MLPRAPPTTVGSAHDVWLNSHSLHTMQYHQVLQPRFKVKELEPERLRNLFKFTGRLLSFEDNARSLWTPVCPNCKAALQMPVACGEHTSPELTPTLDPALNWDIPARTEACREKGTAGNKTEDLALPQRLCLNPVITPTHSCTHSFGLAGNLTNKL